MKAQASWARITRFAPSLLLGVVLGVAGCGNEKGTVSGHVKVGDQPVVQGTVIFTAGKEQQTYNAPIQSDGSYKAEGVPVGEAIVTVDSPKPPESAGGGGMPMAVPQGLSPEAKKQFEKQQQARQGQKEKWVEIPKDYSNPSAKKLTFEVKKGDNKFDINIPAQ